MKLLIDIPDEDYNEIEPFLNGEKIRGGFNLYGVLETIMNGTPLPKWHGRLIDAREYENSIRKHYFDNSTVIRCTEIALDNAPTIIEADKAENEGEE